MPKTTTDPKLTTKLGSGTLSRKLTKAQAQRYGDRNMPRDLKAAGFETVVATTSLDLHGWHGYRINYGKHVGS